MPRKAKGLRLSRLHTLQMPSVLDACHVIELMQWPLGSVMLRKAGGMGWTDCIAELDYRIRLGGLHNTRRVRYDGRFFVSWRGRNVYFVGELAWRAWDTVQHVYGLDDESDALHNVWLKGY